MYLGLCLFGVIAIVWVIAAFATSPAAAVPGPRDHDRRAAQVRACPDRATILDVENLLRAHPLPDRTVARVLGTAAERRITSRTLWCWADRFGAEKLVLAIDADLADRRLRRYLDAGTTPDWSALEVFASLNDNGAAGVPFSEVLDLDALPAPESVDLADWETPGPDEVVPVATDADLSQFDHLPPIYDPGLPLARTVAPPHGAPRPHAGGDDPWPMVA
jgi:hypothetical protein